MSKSCPFCRTSAPDSNEGILALVRKRVNARDPDAKDTLACAYFGGKHGLQQNIPWAIELWTEAARLGDLNAHYRLGRVYYYGKGAKEDETRGICHWQHAAVQGHPSSRHALGCHEYENGNHELAVQHYLISAKMGLDLSLDKIKSMFIKGLATKAQYADALKGYQIALEETKSPQREVAKTFFSPRG